MLDLGRGMAAGQAVRRLLAARGGSPEPLLLEAMDASPAGILEALQRFRLHGRWAKGTADHLGAGELPTLAQGPAGTYILLLARRGRNLLMEGHRGQWLQPASSFQGTLLDIQEELPERGVARALLGLLLARRRALAPLGVLILASQGLTALAPYWTRILVDRAFPAGAQSLFALIVAAALAQAAFQGWLGWLQGRYVMFVENRVALALERGFLHRLLNLPFRFFNGRSLGELLQGFQGLAAAREALIAQALPALASLATALLYLVLLSHQFPRLALFAVATAMLPALILAVAAAPAARLESRAVDAGIRQWGLLAELFNGLPTLKAAGAEGATLARWREQFWQERSLRLAAQRTGLLGRSGAALAGQFQGQILNVWGALAVLEGSISLGTLLAFTMMAGALQGSLEALGTLWAHFVAIRPQVKVTDAILAAEPEPPPPARGHAKPAEGVEVEHLSFRYHPHQPWVLREVSLRVGPGQVLRLPGPSGSGKTTLLRLLAGLLEPEAGRIRLFGMPPRAARSHLCYLPQRVRLFQGTIHDNLRLFSGGADWAHLREVGASTGLTQWVERLPMQWDTWVAMNGGNFSAGERQMVALTGVLAAGRNLLLLDEAMANLDLLRQGELEANPFLRGKTIIYASHDALLNPESP